RLLLHLAALDDDGDLAAPAVRGGLERLPELALLKLAVAGEHEDSTVPASEPVGEDEPARLRDAHAERATARHHLGRRRDVGVTRQPVEPPEPVDQLEVEAGERREARRETRKAR